jgi:AraC-like DNA-binding protein
MHAYFISLLIELLASQGIDQDQLLNGTGATLADIHSPQGLTAAQLDAIFSSALELSQDPTLGLRLGSKINITAQGIIGYALMTSTTVEDALNLLVRYNRALLPSLRISLHRGDARAALRVEGSQLPRQLEQHYVELLYAAIAHNGRIFTGAQTSTTSLALDYSPRCDPQRYYDIFGPNVSFDQPLRALSFDKEALGYRISTADPAALEIFRRECDRLIVRGGHGGTINERVQQVLLQSGSEFPTAARVAQQLNMSESTLQRRLTAEGWRYQQLLDRVRYTLADEYLTGTLLPVAEIAALLGFSDATNFRRSYRRWSGTTPSQLRR